MQIKIRSLFSKNLLILISFVALLIAIIPAVSTVYQLNRLFVEIKAQLTGTTRAQLFYDHGPGLSEQRYSIINIPSDSGFQILRFEIPPTPLCIRSLILRPVGMRSTVNIEFVKFISNSNAMPLNIPAEVIKPLSQLEPSDSSLDGGNDIKIKIVPNVMKSTFIIKPAAPLYLKPSYSIIMLSGLKVLLGYFLFVFLILSVAILLCQPIIRYIKKKVAVRLSIESFIASRKATIIICIVILGIIFGARLWLINSFGSDLPQGDAWGAEGIDLYKPYFEGTLNFSSLFSPHNEHRIFFTRVLSLSLLLINGQWDTKLQMQVNAIIFAAICCGIFLLYIKSMRGCYQIMLAISIVSLFVLPFGWENTLSGFQSCFYFLIGFSIATIWLLEHHKPWTIKWGLGVFLGISCLFTLASGFLAPLAVLGTILIRTVRAGNEWIDFLKSRKATMAICVFIIIIGFLITPTLEYHRYLRAHSISEFFSAFSRLLAWPNLIVSWWSIFNWLPFATLLVAYIWNCIKDDRATRFTIGLGLLILLQAGATAFSRGAGAPQLSSRYTDILSFGTLANICCLITLWKESERVYSKIKRIIPAMILLIWLPINIAGLSLVSNMSFFYFLPRLVASYEAQRFNVAAFMKTSNIEYLKDKPLRDTPTQFPDRLAAILREPVIKKILPWRKLIKNDLLDS